MLKQNTHKQNEVMAETERFQPNPPAEIHRVPPEGAEGAQAQRDQS